MERIVEDLSARIQGLSPVQLTRVEELVTSLESGKPDTALSRSALLASEGAFAAVWSNPEDDAYNEL